MGIPGLTRFLDDNTSILGDIELANRNVIIDGNNLLHFLYYYYQTSHVYGGDYKVYAEACEHFFETLDKCKVVPYVIFDGAYHPKGKKFSSSLNRATKRAISAAYVAKGGSERVLPLLCIDVFVEILEFLGVKYAFCSFEADYHIASLAALWKCPVMTNDSDFFIYDLPGGVILLDYLNINLKTDVDGTNHLNAQIYYVSNLAKWAGISNISLLRLFATLMGNDVIDGDIFLPFCKKHDYFSKILGMKLKKNEHKKIPGILKWLALKRNLSTAVREVVESFHSDGQDSVRILVEKSMSSYNVGHTFLFNHFQNGSLDNELESSIGFIPEWFRRSIHKGVLTPRMSNALISQRCILPTQVESFKCISSHHCGLPIRQRIYGILLKENQIEEKEHEMREYDRGGRKIVKKVVRAETKLCDGSELPSLLDAPSLNEERKLFIILDLFEDTQRWFLNFPLEEHLFLASLTHWVTSGNPKPEKCQALSLLIYFYAPEFLQELINDDSDIEFLYESIETTLSHQLGKAKNRQRYFDVNRIHNFSQFQSCFRSLADLNKILFHPFRDISITRVFCATSLSYICYHLECALQNIYEFLESNFRGNVLILEKIWKIWTKLGFNANQGAQIEKKQHKKKLNNKIQEAEKRAETQPDSPEFSSSPTALMFNLDIENRFSKLFLG